MRTILLITALHSGGPDLPDADLAAGSADVEVRLHSIRDLLGPVTWSDEALSLLPYRWSSNADFEVFLDREEGLQPFSEDIHSLVRECVVPEYWDGAGSLDVFGDRLVVAARESVHEEVEGFLRSLSQAMVGRARLHVTVYEARTGADEALLRPTAESTSLLAGLVQEGRARELRHVSMDLPTGLLQRAESLDVESLPYGYVSEIAQGATVAAPVHASVATGLTVLARGTRTRGATLIDLLLRHAEEVGRDRYDTGGRSQILTDSAVHTQFHTGTVEHPHLAFVSLATSVLIPDGHSLWIPCSLDLESGGLDLLIELRIEGKGPASRSQIALPTMAWEEDEPDQSPYQLVLRDTAFLRRRGVSAPGIANTLFDFDPGYFWESELVVAHFSSEAGSALPADLLVDLARNHCDPDAWDEDPRNSMRILGPWLATTGRQELVDTVDTLMDRLSETRMHLVRGRLERDGRRVGTFVLPMVEGLAGTLWAGVQSTGLSHWEMEVANHVSCSEPRFQALVDGIALNLHPTPGEKGRLRVDVNGKVHLLTEPPAPERYEPEISFRPQTDSRLYTRVRARSLAMDDRIDLQEGAEPFRFGNGRAALSLEGVPVQD